MSADLNLALAHQKNLHNADARCDERLQQNESKNKFNSAVEQI